ncbi:NIPSNAP family protein [Streptomyces sp. NPDC052040]|uniref:NIPSNAP family protein n=1 Tax=Streptomyces sp. NPDC052040 TaxID=3365682 RepID=UPI0037CD55F0
MFYEIRRYQTRPGRRDAWVRYMEEVNLPFQQSLGMVVTGSFVDEEDPDGYVWIRRFESEEHCQKLCDAVYGSDRWQREMRPVVEQLLLMDRTVVTRVHPTPASALR